MSNPVFTQLHPILQSTLEALGYCQPTEIQQQTIPLILQGSDLMGAAQTGTGKTAAFALPLIHQLLEEGERGHPRVLIVTPTRELAQQVFEKITEYSLNTGFNSVALYGGSNIGPQKKALGKGVDMVVGTPGRLLDHLYLGTLKLNNIKYWVLDEADRMLDMGFLGDIQRLMRKMPSARQTLFFSATFPKHVCDLAHTLLNDPAHITVSSTNSTANTLTQRVYEVDKKRKSELLSYLIGHQNLQQVLVFTKTRQTTQWLADELKRDGLEAQAIHGDKTQGARQRALDGFKEGKIRVLVATDVAARGLDIPSLDTVFNYELPYLPEDYVHRIGRAGRAGKPGTAISLVSRDEEGILKAIETFIDMRLPSQWLEGYEPSLKETHSNHDKRSVRGAEKRKLKRLLTKKAQGARR